MSEQPQKNKPSLSALFTVELVIAVCAVVISVASFYATYLQAEAAEKQVKAMTVPLLSFSSSNVDPITKSPTIVLAVENKGVGPATIKDFAIHYDGDIYMSQRKFLDACCGEERTNFINYMKKEKIPRSEFLGWVTSRVNRKILPSNDAINFISVPYDERLHDFWEKLNKARSKTHVSACYCSLLDDCYWLSKNNSITPVEACSN